jgi:hypothetical protein
VSIEREALERHVLAAFWSHLEQVKHERVDVDVELEQLRQVAEHDRYRLEQATVDTELEELLGRREFIARIEAFKAKAGESQQRLDESLQVAGRSSGQTVAELREQWPVMTVDEQRQAVSRVIRYVFVRPSPDGRIMPRSINGNLQGTTFQLADGTWGIHWLPTGTRSRKQERETGFATEADARAWLREHVVPQLREQADELRRTHVADRVHIVWATDPDVVIPRQGSREYAIEPFVFPDANPDSVRVTAG